MQKKVLTEQILYHGNVSMPKGWEVDRNDLAHHILESSFNNKNVLYSRTLSKVSDYIKEHLNLKFKLSLFEKEITGQIYRPGETTLPLLNVNPVDLTNSPDYTMLYGVNVKDCMVRIHYDHNRRAGRSWDIPLINNKFLIFPSTNMYCITNNQKDSMNFIQTITYDYREL